LSGTRKWTSSEPFFTYALFMTDTGTGRGNWSIAFDVLWAGCTENERGAFIGQRDRYCACGAPAVINFAISEGGKAIDLAANDGKPCAAEIIHVGEEFMELSSRELPKWTTNNKCAMMAPDTLPPTADHPCPVKISSGLNIMGKHMLGYLAGLLFVSPYLFWSYVFGCNWSEKQSGGLIDLNPK
ncbi:hypothetical protein C8A00DRAFT_16648, partial [Chaetomidium leptoderma]